MPTNPYKRRRASDYFDDSLLDIETAPGYFDDSDTDTITPNTTTVASTGLEEVHIMNLGTYTTLTCDYTLYLKQYAKNPHTHPTI